jgi:hypothetical protein
VLEDGTRPEYIIPVGSMNGTWDMVKRAAAFRGEGWLSLWKGESLSSGGVLYLISVIMHRATHILYSRRTF